MFSSLRMDLAWYSKTLLEKIILAILKGLSTMSLKEDYKILKAMNIKGVEKKVYVVNYRHKVGREGSLTMTNRLATLKGMVYSNPYLIGK